MLLVVENISLARDHRRRKQAAALIADGYPVSVICRRDSGNDAIAGVRVHEDRAPVAGDTKLGFVRWDHQQPRYLNLYRSLFSRPSIRETAHPGTPAVRVA